MKNSFLLSIIFFGIIFQTMGQNTNLKLEANLSYGSEGLSNIWSWKDPQDGIEYALVGAANGMSVVDVSTPSSPKKIVQIPGPNSIWREIRTNGNYAYITTEAGGGLQIVDLTNLPNTNLTTKLWTPTISGTVLGSIHSLQIDNGKIYLYGSQVGKKGAIIADITTDPMNPKFLGLYDVRYVHDGYVRNDTMYSGHIYDGEFAVVDAKKPASPQVLATVKTPTAFTHNTWLSTNSKYCFTTDENKNSFLGAFDVSNLADITEVDRIQSNPGCNAVVHNTYVIKKSNADFAVTSWYKEGVVICDVSRPWNMVQVGNYDTSPSGTATGMDNNWGVDPFLPSGIVVASDIQNGLFVFSPTYTRACFLEGVIKNCTTGLPLFGAKVEILKSPVININSATDITDAKGKYGVGVLPSATYSVMISKSGYISQTFTVSLSTGNVTALNVDLCNGNGVVEYEKLFNNASVFPNPFNSSALLTLTQNNIEKIELNIYDVCGREIQKANFHESLKLDGQNFIEGIYYYKVVDGGNVIALGKFVVAHK
jgi:choice-of-anchor B domain-containing protein